jgi:catechol 2,3-dioxygenase-like lactoylglutathione lyase family enzyme
MITGVNHLTLAVRDIEESFTFYHDVLGFTPIQKNPISAYLLAGEMWIALTLDAHARQEALPEYTHIAFTVAPADFDALKARLMQAGVQEWQTNQTEGASYYFVDPNGHKLEIHASDLATRIATAKQTWGDAVHWFV